MATANQEVSHARVSQTKDVKPFLCDKCNSKGFRTVGAKTRHEKEEHNPMKYKCEDCGYRTKRRYQMVNHRNEAHPGQQASTIADYPSNRGSRDSVDSLSSEDAAASHLRHARGSPFPQSLSTQQSLPNSNRGFSDPKEYNQYPVASSYSLNTSVASYGGGSPIPASISRNHVQTFPYRHSYSTTSPNSPFMQSSGIPWGAPGGASQPTAINLPSSDPTTMGPPSQVNNTISSRPPYYPGDSRGGHNNASPYAHSPYASPSSEQGSPFSYSTGSSYAREASQPNDWP